MSKVNKHFKFSSTYYRKVNHQIGIQKREYLKRLKKLNNLPIHGNVNNANHLSCTSSAPNLSTDVSEKFDCSSKIQGTAKNNIYDNLDFTLNQNIDDEVPSVNVTRPFEALFDENIENVQVDSDKCSFEEEKNLSIAKELRKWALTYHITHKAMNDLLRILIIFGFSWLPRDCRSLLKTPRCNQVSPMGNGKFWYNGLEKCLQNIFANIKEPKSISLTFNIDGLPIYNSSKYQFWPILAIIDGMKEMRPMVIAVYCGEEKPPLQLYLKQFVEETKHILTNGVQINGFQITTFIRCFICDSPARAFIKGTVNFNSAHGCQKCEVIGEYDYYRGRHMSFPRINCALRTDHKFRNQTDEDHHKERTPLIDLHSVDLVEDFIIADSLHLLELGLMKRCLIGWVYGDFNFKAKLSASDVIAISKSLEESNKRMPTELHRAIRALSCLKYWKGLEFRTFLLYLGMVVLKDHLSTEVYHHFLKLCCAVLLCSCKEYLQYLDLADVLFKEYIEGFIDIYGMDAIQSNVHNLSHVVADVKKFGDLTTLTAYPFESFLGAMKYLLRQGNLPLEQLSNRINELEALSATKETNETNCPYIRLRQKNKVCYTYLYIKSGIMLSNENDKDKWFLTRDHEIVEMINAVTTSNSISITGASIKRKYNFFTLPFSSANINIYSTFGERNRNKLYNINEIKCKLISLKYKNELVFMPLLHTLDLMKHN